MIPMLLHLFVKRMKVQKWKRIGYVVREAASEVLSVINYLASNFHGSSFYLTLRTEVGMLR